MKRKRRPKLHQETCGRQRKKRKNCILDGNTEPAPSIHHPVLRSYFSRVITLRQYLLENVSKCAKGRRQRLERLGQIDSPTKGHQDYELSFLLDSILVAHDDRDKFGCVTLKNVSELKTFTQQVQRSSDESIGSLNASQSRQLSDLVDFCVHAIFRRYAPNYRPPHLLCHGYRYASTSDRTDSKFTDDPGIAGLVSIYPNPHVEQLKGQLWSNLLRLLGKEGEAIFIKLLLNHFLFMPLTCGHGKYKQLSGIPLSELRPRVEMGLPLLSKGYKRLNKLIEIRFIRNRMFYAKPDVNRHGSIQIGLKRINILNRCKDSSNLEQTVHVMKYIFPRQFHLHNVFTSETNSRDTAQRWKDYTLREQEIWKSYGKINHLPKRIRGQPFKLISRLRRRHSNCSYAQVFQHYCSVNEFICTHQTSSPNKSSEQSLTELACSLQSVSAFCRAIVTKVIPSEAWGVGEAKSHNEQVIMHHTDQFVRMRKFESPTLLEVVESIKISPVKWLVPPNCHPDDKMSASDYSKRKEILFEFIYWLFDSFLISVIQSFFYVTESSTHRYQLFFFRHDIWRNYTEPSITNLKLSMFDEMKVRKAAKVLERRHLTYSQVRLLPKAIGVRPIINLRRRIQVQLNGRRFLSRSINSVLKPLFSVLNFEKAQAPERLGSSLFSVEDIFHRLKAFKSSLSRDVEDTLPLYFVKVDVKSCFDTIPQKKLLSLLQMILSKRQYKISRHAEVRVPNKDDYRKSNAPSKKPAIKFYWSSCAAGYEVEDTLANTYELPCKPGTVRVDAASEQIEQRENLLAILYEHLERNIVKFGQKYYRQVIGVPQGSILSTLLCSFFYADMESKYLSFLESSSSLVLRLVDDFLLITSKKQHALRFLEIMQRGIPEFGLSVKSEKTKTNFNVSIDGKVSYGFKEKSFPYCGIRIDTTTLELSKDQERVIHGVKDSLTIDFSKVPGQTLYRKTMNALKIQMHAMLTDTLHNSVATVMSNLYSCFLETAKKLFCYAKTLPVKRRPSNIFLLSTDTLPVKSQVDICADTDHMHRDHQRCSFPCMGFNASQRKMLWKVEELRV